VTVDVIRKTQTSNFVRSEVREEQELTKRVRACWCLRRMRTSEKVKCMSGILVSTHAPNPVSSTVEGLRPYLQTTAQ
jgi:hypothetical protein